MSIEGSLFEYRGELDRIDSVSGSKRESGVREAFKDLLERWGKSRDRIFLAEIRDELRRR